MIVDKPISRKINIVVQEFENELLIYDLRLNKAFCLNQTSALVYQLCDGTKTIAEVGSLMSKSLKTSVSEDFVRLALHELNRENLLENAGQLKSYFAGFSRREAVKKVGLASMIALPVISSLIAPTALMAQSGCANVVCEGACCDTGQNCFGPVGSMFCCRPVAACPTFCCGLNRICSFSPPAGAFICVTP